MNQDELKRQAALAAMDYLPDGGIIGVGTGSTVNHFIDALATIKGRFEGAASSSEASTERMKQHGIPVLDLNSCGTLILLSNVSSKLCRVRFRTMQFRLCGFTNLAGPPSCSPNRMSFTLSPSLARTTWLFLGWLGVFLGLL